MVIRGDATGLDEFSDKIEQAYIDRLADAGEKACADAVAEGNYQNITGNLRSSIGYVIGYDGKVIREGGFHKVQGRGENMQHVVFTTRSGKKVDFWAKGKFGDGSEGSKRGRDMAWAQAAILTSSWLAWNTQATSARAATTYGTARSLLWANY